MRFNHSIVITVYISCTDIDAKTCCAVMDKKRLENVRIGQPQFLQYNFHCSLLHLCCASIAVKCCVGRVVNAAMQFAISNTSSNRMNLFFQR